MLQSATGFYIWVSLGIFCALACLAECESCPLEGVCKPVDYALGLKNTYSWYFGLDHGPEGQNKFPDTENDGCCSTLYDSHSKEQRPRRGNSDVYRSNVGWLSDDLSSHLPDGVTLACSLNIRWLGHEKLPPSVNISDQIALSPSTRYLLYKREVAFNLLNIKIKKSSSSQLSSPCLSISPKKLDWGQNYRYYPSVAFLRLKNICSKNAIKVFEPFSTDSQFFSFNYSDVVLGPGEVSSIPFVFLPKSLGLSSAELVLQTSVGGFLVQAKGRVIESPHRLVPLVGLVPQGFHQCNISDDKKSSSDNIEQLVPVVITIGPLSKWLTSPCSTENIVEMAYPPYSEKKFGSICMKLFIPLEGAEETIMVPLEAVINNTVMCKGVVPSLSAFIRAAGRLDKCEMTNFGNCLKRQAESEPNLHDIADSSYGTGSLSSSKRSSVSTKAMGDADVDGYVLQKWKDQSTMRGVSLLDDHELFFPLVPLDTYFAKSITVKNPSKHPVMVQLILNPGLTVDNCKQDSHTHMPSPWSGNLFYHDSTGPIKYGFSTANNTVAEAFLHPYGESSLGPIFFHPSNRCEWKSSALIRNNLSGVEQLSLRGFGGLLQAPELNHKPLVLVKICFTALVLAASLMFILFWFIMPQMVLSDTRSIPPVRPKEKSSTLTNNQVKGKTVKVTKKGHLKSVDSSDVSNESTTSPSLISKLVEFESYGKEEAAPPVCLTVRTRKDKRRRARKRSGVTSVLKAHLEASSSQSGNSTPSSPLSPITTPSPKNICSKSSSENRSQESRRPIEEAAQNCQPSPNSTESRPTLFPSATFPGTGRSELGPPYSHPSRLAISPHARAPGPKIKPEKTVQEEERTNPEGRVYDIWGNHFFGPHLMGRSDDSNAMESDFIGHSGSFFVSDPRQSLLMNAAPVTVSRSIEDG